MRFSWIQGGWEDYYIRCARDIILTLVRPPFNSAVFLSHDLQMRQYRNQKSSMSEATTTNFPLQDEPVSVVKLAPTQFKVQDSVYRKKSICNAFSVDVKFQKYISGSISFKETNILRFWEVR